ncbi:MAG TPA: carboxypeptidase-like regulatory domain-containing protein [Caulifigura sp.]|jgi:hypothetical protein|nr:carboxypeptidase-like regulatory domain-containing protein [Caulifigura sp.]
MIRSSASWRTGWFLSGLVMLGLCGCGRPENIGRVSGQVTLDGAPLEGALVQFEPLAGNSPSGGLTDAAGKYSLTYTREIKGAEIGEHRVIITTQNGGDPDASPPIPKSPERLPARYNRKSELRAKVETGTNMLDFKLESGNEAKGKAS